MHLKNFSSQANLKAVQKSIHQKLNCELMYFTGLWVGSSSRRKGIHIFVPKVSLKPVFYIYYFITRFSYFLYRPLYPGRRSVSQSVGRY